MTNESIQLYINAATIVLTFVGGILVLVQWRGSINLKRAEFVHQIMEAFRGDPAVVQAMYQFDYEPNWYTAAFHGGSALEAKVDKALSHMTYICYLRRAGYLRRKDFRIFEYEIGRAVANPSVQAYMFNLYHFSKKCGLNMAFAVLVDYARGQLPPAFFDAGSSRYPKYLNF